MSKNYELLQRLESQCRRQANFWTSPVVLRPSLNADVGPNTFDGLSNLVQRLFLGGTARARVVVFSGVEAGVGCTWITAHSAQVLSARTPARICVVDAGASPGMDQYFEADPGGDRPASDIDALVPARQRQGNIWLLSSLPNADDENGPAPAGQLAWCVRELRKEFEYLLIDAPPVAYGSALPFVAAGADGIVLVVKACSTRRDAVRAALQQLEAAGGKPLGTVLNQQKHRIPRAIYKRL